MGWFTQPKKENRTYTLETGQCKVAHDDITVAGMAHQLKHFTTDEWDFISLSANPWIQNSTFLQVGAPMENCDCKMQVEIGFKKSNEITMFRYYTADKDEVLQMLTDYYERQKLPDISAWEDVSDELK